ncbi:amidase [Paraburkholderia xenovorans]|uniref:Amidase n=1 Tax=Paraburkholderia xenovorans (strain LB400) TaxID=266265 RepID=Q13GZ2_PARXL|nr:amidase [Paraburkholderia xenovorans]ABE36647.1 Putative amidase [Paraburkholderia xenovorans LB400]
MRETIPELVALGAVELRSGLVSGRFGWQDVALQYLQHIDNVNPHLNALVRVERDAWEQSLNRFEQPLGGVPVSVKDNIWVGGRRTSNGSRLFSDFIAPEDALCVARLRGNGAVLIGSSNCSEFACKGNTTNILYGATRHPLDAQRTPGGSSGGAAAAVAAGLCAVAIATDAGGSVRRPAAHTGVVGFKPTAGVIAHGPGFAEPVYGNNTIGILARSVGDVRLVFEQLHGHQPRDPASVSSAMLGRDGTGQRLKIAFSPRLGLGFAVDPGIAQAVEHAVRLLADAGHAVEYRDPPWFENVQEADLMPLQLAGLATIYADAFRNNRESFDPDIAAQIDAGLSLPAVAVTRALELRKRLFAAMCSLFDRVDCLLTPTAPCVAWRIENNAPQRIEGKPVGPRDHAVFTPLFNHTYVPACSVPCGLAEHGLPAGLQIVGPMYSDRMVLGLSAEVERLLGHRWQRPTVKLGRGGGIH